MLYIATGNFIKVWSLEEEQQLSSMNVGKIQSMVVCEDNRTMLVASKNSITIWDLVTLNNVSVLVGHKETINTLFTHGNLLFSGSKKSKHFGGH